MKKIVRYGMIALALVGLGSVSQKANAAYISGSIFFAGDGAVSDNGTLTTVSFQNTGPNQQVISGVTPANGSNSYFGVPVGGVQPVTFNSLSVKDTNHSLNAPVSPLWTFTFSGVTYSFALTSISSFVYNPGVSITLSGAGVATITGGATNYLPTAGIYSLSGVYDSTLSAFQFVLTDEETAQNVPVPDGGATLALMGLALAGIGAIRFVGRKQLAA